MASAATIAWIERLIWILIYAGLFAFVIGIAAMQARPATAWSLIVVGAIVAIAGVILVWVRSRLGKPQ